MDLIQNVIIQNELALKINLNLMKMVIIMCLIGLGRTSSVAPVNSLNIIALFRLCPNLGYTKQCSIPDVTFIF